MCGSDDGFPDLVGLRVAQVSVEDVPVKRPGSRVRPEELFLRGPISLPWLGRACELPGKALATGLAIWFLSGLRRQRKEGLLLTNELLSKFGVTDRTTKYRALRALKKAGLIHVDQQIGKNPLVTIVDVASLGIKSVA
jgi:hypothetical protein